MSDTLARALESDDTGMDRRKLLKMGIWAAPVVVLATATPAAASSPSTTPVQNLNVTASGVSYINDGSKFTGIAGSVAIKLQQSAGPLTSAEGITVTLTIDSASLQKTAPTNLSAGWSSAPPVESGTNFIYTFSHPTALAPEAASTLDFTMPGVAGFSATVGRAWQASTSATVTGGSVDGTTVKGVVTAQVATATTSAVISGEPSFQLGTGSTSKQVAVTVATATNAAMIAKMSVKRTHSQDRFIGDTAWDLSNQTVGSDNYLIATSGSLPATTPSVAFPKFHEQNTGDVHEFTIEFLFGGVAYAPATRRGSF